MIVNLALYLLKNARISLKDRMRLTNAILDKLNAIPVFDIIGLNEKGQVTINNRILDQETGRKIRESAKSAVKNRALRLVHEQVAFKAVSLGVHKAESNEQVLFSKAALWYGQQEKEILEALAQLDASELDLDDE